METGQVIAGRYRLISRLGAGGMSVVFRAHDDVLERDVAVKVLSPELAADPELLQRIQLEARAAARLRHPNVVEVHDYGTADSLPYVVMELVDGRSLADLLVDGALPWRVAVRVCAQVAAALAAAHDRGVVHRDVKPGNVMVTPDGVKLVDFGISATAGEADGDGGEVIGTPAYLAPERLGGGPVRPATDVYALGLLLYLTLAGHLPWEASTTTQMLKAHQYLEPAGLPPVPGLPVEVADLCQDCMAKDPDDRPSAADAARVLTAAIGIAAPPPLLSGSAAPADDPTPPTEPVAAFAAGRAPLGAAGAFRGATSIFRPAGSERRLTLLVAGGAALIIAIAVSAWFVVRPHQSAVQAAAQPECTVRYAVQSALNGRFSTAVTLVNTGAVAAKDWQLTFALPAGQKLVKGTGWQQNGQSLRLTGKELAAGASTTSGFDATYQDSTTLPAQFRLNDIPCQSELSVLGRTVQPTPPASTRPARGNGNSGKGSNNSGSGNSGSGNSGSGNSGSNSGSGSGTSGSGSSGGGNSGSGSSGGTPTPTPTPTATTATGDGSGNGGGDSGSGSGGSDSGGTGAGTGSGPGDAVAG